MACIHGYDPSDCLICRSLEPSSAGGRPAVATSATTERRRGHLATHALVLLVVLVLAALSGWLVTRLLYAIFHLAELVIVAGLAGTLGYRLGHARGRRGH